MAILGVYDGHNCGAALLREGDGTVLAAVEEERFSRTKNHDGRVEELSGPIASIEYCLAVADEPVTGVALALEEPADLHRRALGEYFAAIEGGDVERLRCREIRGRPVEALDLVNHPFDTQRQRVAETVRCVEEAGLAVDGIEIAHVPHHRAHAASAFLCTPADDALVVTMDGKGDGLSASIHLGTGADLHLVDETPYTSSLGHLYGAATVLCGFRAVKHEGKVTALAASGTVDEEASAALARLFSFDAARGRVVGRLNEGLPLGPYPHTLFKDQIERLRHLVGHLGQADLAATVQHATEQLVLDVVQFHCEASGRGEVAVAGGLFANVGVNGMLALADGCTQLYVQPAMSDAGLPLGAAAEVYTRRVGTRPRPMAHAMLGPEYAEADVLAAFSGFHLVRSGDAAPAVARALAAGLPVARFAGRSEYGPRALGHRSLLAPAGRPEVAAELNTRLSRTHVMPFAPIVPEEDADRLFRGLEKVAWSSRFMTVALPCTTEMRTLCPAAVHRDGTARPQVLSAAHDDELHRALVQHRDLSGQPAVINTSLNLHDEPMVLSPDDARRSIVAGEIPVVAIPGAVLCLSEEVADLCAGP